MTRFAASLFLLAASACSDGSPLINSSCEWVRPIRPLQSDMMCMSDALVEQILQHNEKGAELAGWTSRTPAK